MAPNGTCVNSLRTVKFRHTRSHPLKSWLGLPVFNWPLLTSRFPPPLLFGKVPVFSPPPLLRLPPSQLLSLLPRAPKSPLSLLPRS